MLDIKTKIALALCLLIVLFMLPACNKSDGLTGRTINIYDVIGSKATLTKADAKEYAAKKGLRLGADYGVSTGDVTYVYFNLDDKSLAKLDEVSKVNVDQISDSKLRLDLAGGAILINEREKSAGDLEIRAGNITIGIRGTFITAKLNSAEVTVIIIDGAIEVTTESGDVTPVGALKRVTIVNDMVTITDLTWNMLDRFTRDCILEYQDDLSDILSEDDFNAVRNSTGEDTTTPDEPPDEPINANVGEIIEFGGYNWRVLAVENGRALILSENIIEQRAYHNNDVEITWEYCDLRQYLNGEFYNRFSTSEQNRIAETRLNNSNNQWYGTYGGNDTIDKIFLLSLAEMVRYFGDSGQLLNRPIGVDHVNTIYSIDDQYNTARIATYNGTASEWWLRSPGSDIVDTGGTGSGGDIYAAANVRNDGRVGVYGTEVSGDLSYGGVRPALWLNLSQAPIATDEPQDTSGNLVDTMSATEYRKLNEMLTEVDQSPGLAKLADAEGLISFGAYVAMYLGWEQWERRGGSKEAVEAILNRYFGVEKINHEKSGIYRSWPEWDVDYPIDGAGPSVSWEWVNVANLQDIGNGMLLANVDIYYVYGASGNNNWDDSFLGPVSQWKLQNGATIIDCDAWGDVQEPNIGRYGKCTVMLKPFLYKGENTWQIVGINDYEIPKVLFP